MTNALLDRLDCVIDLLSVPERWTKGDLAINEVGRPVRTSDPDAASFCLIGAVIHCTVNGSEMREALEKELNITIENQAPSFDGIADWNDHPTRQHSSVVKLLRKTRARLTET